MPAIVARLEWIHCVKRGASTHHPQAWRADPSLWPNEENRRAMPRAPEMTELSMTLNAALVENEPTRSVSRKDNTRNVVSHTNGPRFTASRRHLQKGLRLLDGRCDRPYRGDAGRSRRGAPAFDLSHLDDLSVAGGWADVGKGGPSIAAGGPIQMPLRWQFVVTCPPAATGDFGRKR